MPSAQTYSSLQLSMLRRIPPGIRSLGASQGLTGDTVKCYTPLERFGSARDIAHRLSI
jgi:hypothetical protein